MALPREAAQERHGRCHEDRRRDAFARHVSDGREHAVGAEPQDLEEIAAHLAGRLEHRVHIEARSLNLRPDIRRQEARLNLSGNAEVPLRRCLHGLRVRLRLQQRTDAGLHLENLEWLRQIIVAADLEAAGLVVHILERAEKHDRQLAGRLRCAQPAADLVAVDIRHDDVEQNQIGRAPVYRFQGLLSAESNREFVVAAECLDQNVDVRLDVVHDEHPGVGQFLHRVSSAVEVRPRHRSHERGDVSQSPGPCRIRIRQRSGAGAKIVGSPGRRPEVPRSARAPLADVTS